MILLIDIFSLFFLWANIAGFMNSKDCMVYKTRGPVTVPKARRHCPLDFLVGKLKILCQSFFKLKSTKLKLFLQEEGPLLADVANSNNTTILVDEES
ncbi:Tubulin-folding cofactor E-like protein [Drosera capensis]